MKCVKIEIELRKKYDDILGKYVYKRFINYISPKVNRKELEELIDALRFEYGKRYNRDV